MTHLLAVQRLPGDLVGVKGAQRHGGRRSLQGRGIGGTEGGVELCQQIR